MAKLITPRIKIIVAMIIWGTIGTLILSTAYISERGNVNV